MEENGLIANLSHLKTELMTWKSKKWKILESIKNKNTGSKARKKERKRKKETRKKKKQEERGKAYVMKDSEIVII